MTHHRNHQVGSRMVTVPKLHFGVITSRMYLNRQVKIARIPRSLPQLLGQILSPILHSSFGFNHCILKKE
jgi:hypothetical protein